MKKESKRTQQRTFYILLAVVTTIAFLVFRPVIAYADPGPAIVDDLEVHLAEVPLYSQLDNAGAE